MLPKQRNTKIDKSKDIEEIDENLNLANDSITLNLDGFYPEEKFDALVKTPREDLRVVPKLTKINKSRAEYVTLSIEHETLGNINVQIKSDKLQYSDNLINYVKRFSTKTYNAIEAVRLRSEVENMSKGIGKLPLYDKATHGSKKDYLYKYFKQYLSCFREDNLNVLYLDDFRKIVGQSFVLDLNRQLKETEGVIASYYVPKKTKKTDKELEEFEHFLAQSGHDLNEITKFQSKRRRQNM